MTDLDSSDLPQMPGTERLSSERLLRGKRHAPARGWRRALYKSTGGFVHPGESASELRRKDLLGRVRTPVADGHHRIAVLSLKGGVGKTTTAVGLGSTLARLRGDRVIAVDANPDRGTLSDRVQLETQFTIRDLLSQLTKADTPRYADVRTFTSQSLSSRLEVLASARDPAIAEAFSADDYRTVAGLLEHFYSISITDCGTGLLHSAMSAILSLAHQIVLVTSPSVASAKSAEATLDWLDVQGHSVLAKHATVVLSSVRPRNRSTVDLDELERYFTDRCRAVVRVPFDPHLEEDACLNLDRLRKGTRDAYLALAATVADAFDVPRR